MKTSQKNTNLPKSSENNSKKTPSKLVEVEIYIDHETGNLLLPRDHELMVRLSEILESEDADAFREFFESKPVNADGEKNYILFCG